MKRDNRYRQWERMMTYALLIDLLFFVLYLTCAITDIGWLKVILSIFVVLLSSAALALLYMTGELRKQRSLWLSAGFSSIVICLIFSLILSFP